MDAGLSSIPAALTAGWPAPDWMRELTSPVVQLATALQPVVPTILHSPPDADAVGDGSWFSRARSGGAFAIGSVASTKVEVYRVIVPIALDHAYMVELCVAWGLLLAIIKGNASTPNSWDRGPMMFQDCNSYTTAVEADKESTTPLVRARLQACRD